jgi:hypothetical protein
MKGLRRKRRIDGRKGKGQLWADGWFRGLKRKIGQTAEKRSQQAPHRGLVQLSSTVIPTKQFD